MFNSLRYTGLSHGLEHILLIPEAALRKLSEMPLLAMGVVGPDSLEKELSRLFGRTDNRSIFQSFGVIWSMVHMTEDDLSLVNTMS